MKISTIVYKVIADSIAPGGRYYETIYNAVSHIADRALEAVIKDVEKILIQNEMYNKMRQEYLEKTVKSLMMNHLDQRQLMNLVKESVIQSVKDKLILGKIEIKIKE